MKSEAVKVGMLVVPFKKTAKGFSPLHRSATWKYAVGQNQPYLYVAGWDEYVKAFVLSFYGNSKSGDFFNAADFEPFVINED